MLAALVAGTVGAYIAAQVGWSGLQARDLGSDDIPPLWMLSLFILILGIPAFLLGSVLGYGSTRLGRGKTFNGLRV